MPHETVVAVHLSAILAQLLFLSSPPFYGRKTLAITTLITLAIASHYAGPASDVAADAQPFALLWPVYLGTLDKFLCAEGRGPEDTYWRIDRDIREAGKMMSFGLSKLKWAAAMMFNMRGVRWNYEISKLPPKPKLSKWSFLAWQMVDFAQMFFMSDLLLVLSERLFWTPPQGHGSFTDSKHLTISHPNLKWSFLKALTFAGGPYFFVNLQYVAASIVAVALNLSQPEDWPPYFGNVREVTTVRHFWGTFWHQTLRRSLTKLTGFMVDTLSVPRGTNLSSYSQIWIAFAASGFMHTQSMLLLPHPGNITFQERTFGIMAFFLWQAFAITFEDFAMWLLKATSGHDVIKSTRVTRVIGYTWVITSFWISLPWAADVMMRLRLTEESFLGFSLVRDLVRRVPLSP